MASLVGVFAASHGPIIARDWETMPRGHRDKLQAGFDEIGRRLERSPAACRQLASRARIHVKADYARREVDEEERERLFGAFSEAVRNFDVDALAKVLTEDAVMLADGGGKVSAVPRPLRGGG